MKLQYNLTKVRGGVKGRLEFFRKFIRFGSVTRPFKGPIHVKMFLGEISVNWAASKYLNTNKLTIFTEVIKDSDAISSHFCLGRKKQPSTTKGWKNNYLLYQH